MTKKITCIECPRGCALSVDTDNGKVVKVCGNECPKGEVYAVSEIENPKRTLTSTVPTEGADLKRLPVKTSGPIPKAAFRKAMEKIRNTGVKNTVRAGDAVIKDFLGLGVDLVATRDCIQSQEKTRGGLSG